MSRLKARNPKLEGSDGISSLDDESFNQDMGDIFETNGDAPHEVADVRNIENTAGSNRAVNSNVKSKARPRKSSFSTIESTPPVRSLATKSHMVMNGRVKQLQFEKEGLSTSLKSAHGQIEELRETMVKLRRQKTKEVKVFNGTITSVRKERDNLQAKNEAVSKKLRQAEQMIQRLQCKVQDKEDEILTKTQAYHLADKNAKDIISTERRNAFEQISKVDHKAQIAMEHLDTTRADFTEKESKWEDEKAILKNALDDALERSETLWNEAQSIKVMNETLEHRVEDHHRRESEVRRELHTRMQKQLEAESNEAKAVSAVERANGTVVAVKKEKEAVVGNFREMTEFERKRAEMAEEQLRHAMKDFASVRDSMSKEITVISSDREVAVGELHALQARVEAAEERCGSYQKQLTEARGELKSTNRIMNEVATVNESMTSMRNEAKEKAHPTYALSIREFTDESIAENKVFRERAEKRLEDDKELDSLRHQKSEFTRKDQVITQLRREKAEYEELIKGEIEAMKSMHQMQLIEAAASRAAEVSAVTSMGSSNSSSASSSASSSPSKEEGIVIAIEGGSPKSKGSGKKKRRVVRTTEDEGTAAATKSDGNMENGKQMEEDIQELMHELKNSQMKAKSAGKEVSELKTALDKANATIEEYQGKLHITSTEIHRFRNMSISGEAEIEALKSHRLRSDSETKADDEEKLKEEIEKHKKEAEFQKEEAGKSKEEAEFHKIEREREKKEHEAHKGEIQGQKKELEEKLETVQREATAHRERAASVDNHLMTISKLHEKVETNKVLRDELERKLAETTEKFIKEEIKAVKLQDTVNDLQHMLNEKEALEEQFEEMKEELRLKDGKHTKQVEAMRADLSRRTETMEEEHGEETREWEAQFGKLEREKKEEGKKRVAEVRGIRERVNELEEAVENVQAEKSSIEKRLKKSKERYEGLLREVKEGGGDTRPVQQQHTPMMQQQQQQTPMMQQMPMHQQQQFIQTQYGTTQATPFFTETVSALTEKCSAYDRQIASLEANLASSIRRESVTKQHLADTLRRLAKAEGKCNELSKSSSVVPPSLQVATAEIKLLKAKAQTLLDERAGLVKKHERDVVVLGRRIQEQAVKLAQLHGLGGGLGEGFGGGGSGGGWREESRQEKENKQNSAESSAITLSELKSRTDGKLKNYSQHRIVTPVRMGGGSQTGGGIGGLGTSKRLIEENAKLLDGLLGGSGF